jgi:glucose/arabinose dehydrogenase
VAGGLVQPVDIQNAGDGTGRLFVLERAGRILVLENGTLLPAPFLDITGEVGSRGSEQGLLGLAFHPAYRENGLFFVNYTDRQGNTVIARFKVSADPNAADAASESVVLTQDQPFANHNGGVLAFGPDGFLYAGLGDGGSGGDPFGNAQNTGTLLGKILRLDVDSQDPYGIPGDNPFDNEVWAYGLRNPWRLSFDRLTHDLYIGDVGQGEWEEIDFLASGSPGGTNFGWNLMEGNHPYNGDPRPDLTPPIAEYSHSQTGGCSVTGGYVYRGQALPEWSGIYLYGDYCSGAIWGLLRTGDTWENQALFETNFNISSFGMDENGELYLADLSGSVYRLEKE